MTDINTELEQIADEVFGDDSQLDEASADAPKKGAVAAEKMDSVEGERQDMGAAVVSPDASSDPGKEASKKKKKASPPTTTSSDASAKIDNMKGIKEEAEEDEDDKDEDENPFAKKKSKKAKDDDDDEEEEVEESLSISDRVAMMDLSTDVEALTEGEDLTEEFKKKAATIFEAALRMKLKEELTEIDETYQAEYAREVDSMQEDMAERVDDYLNYVVEEWLTKNEIEAEHRLKSEIAEGFMVGLKTLFEEHNISVPDEQFDMIDAAAEKVNELESRLNEEIEKNMELVKSNSDLQRSDILLDVASDLADTEVEKFAGLTESVAYEDAEDFREKVETLKESYFPKTKAINSDETAAPEDEGDLDVSGTMANYMSAISRTHIRGNAEA